MSIYDSSGWVTLWEGEPWTGEEVVHRIREHMDGRIAVWHFVPDPSHPHRPSYRLTHVYLDGTILIAHGRTKNEARIAMTAEKRKFLAA